MAFKYANAHEWLGSHLEQLYHQLNSAKGLYAVACALASVVDSDTIQDLFENLMDADGYFEEQARCPEVLDCEWAQTHNCPHDRAHTRRDDCVAGVPRHYLCPPCEPCTPTETERI